MRIITVMEAPPRDPSDDLEDAGVAAFFEPIDALEAPPQALEDALMACVTADLELGRSAAGGWALSVVVGAALAALATLLAASRYEASQVMALPVALGAVMWTAAFSVAVHTLRNARRGPLLALPLAVAVAAILLFPVPHEHAVCAACDSLGMGLPAARLFFATSGLIVGVSLSMGVSRLLGDGWRLLSRTAISGGVVLAAVGPALYLACAPFSEGSLVGLLGGFVAGVFVHSSRAFWRSKRELSHW